MARTRKQPYSGSKRIDATCRNHGKCPWCRSNRTIAAKRAALKAAITTIEAS